MEAARPATSDGPSKSLGPLEARLAAQLAFDESKQKVLEALLADNEDLRKQNMALDMENRRLQHTLDLDQRRHKEMLSEDQFSDTYDWIVDIQLLSDVSKQGWKVRHMQCPLRRSEPLHATHALLERRWSFREASCTISTTDHGSSCCRSGHGRPRTGRRAPTALASRSQTDGAAL